MTRIIVESKFFRTRTVHRLLRPLRLYTGRRIVPKQIAREIAPLLFENELYGDFSPPPRANSSPLPALICLTWQAAEKIANFASHFVMELFCSCFRYAQPLFKNGISEIWDFELANSSVWKFEWKFENWTTWRFKNLKIRLRRHKTCKDRIKHFPQKLRS